MRFHLEMEIEKNVARGLSPEDARREALKSFAGVEKSPSRRASCPA
ncbi:MAG: permease prefix domain 1-containing protein [Acidobacteria bacterium]|nr:permease prefix domain 1-containing protein [Acidobacteriota bacterium]MCA1609585.1 permease prefix domain 1-containing protein [Acidobacteriota bacterium]